MTKQFDVSVPQNSWHDAQRVTKKDLDTEQNFNNQINAAIIDNHFGSGVLPFLPQQTIIFDSDNLSANQAALVAVHNFDGTGVLPSQQPTDLNLGNQLEIELTDSIVFGRLSVKVAVIGLAFDGTVQAERLYFYKNEKQVTAKHYKRILAIFFNDFKGNTLCSRNQGGRIVLRETTSFQISRDPVMVAQDVEPDLFWRDFKISSLSLNLFDALQTGIGTEFNVDALKINITGRPPKSLLSGDVIAQVGQKFQATTNNIQKITLLLGVDKNIGLSLEEEFDWTGDLVISLYPLQTTIISPTDIVPQLAIDFDPHNEPLAQLSFNQGALRELGYVLTNVLQPVDFVFNNTKIGLATPGSILPGNFYAVTARRSGAATQGTILIGCGNNRVDNTRVTLFGGNWVDIPEEDLWFQIWTDAAKVADGQAYDAGTGIIIPKTTVDLTGAVIDYYLGQRSFSNTGENITNTAVIQALEKFTVTTQDERTGNDIFSIKQFIPNFSFVSDADLATLKSVGEPLIIGAFQDTNPKQNPLLTGAQVLPGLVKNDVFCIVNPNPDLLSLNLLGSSLVPNTMVCGLSYKIFEVTLCTDGYGDVDGNGSIDLNDIVRASSLAGEGIYFASSQEKIKNGEIDVLELLRADVDGDGYVSTNDVDLITSYVNKNINAFPIGSTFSHLCLRVQNNIGRYDGYFDCNGYVRLDGYAGLNLIDPNFLTPSELIFDGYVTTPQLQIDPVFTTIPFPGVIYKIHPQPYWQPHHLGLASNARLVPTNFTSMRALVPEPCDLAITSQCQNRNDITPTHDPGRNDFFVPDNLYVGKGQILRPDGSNYKVDFEMGLVILQLPQQPFTESAINIFSKFVADRGDGFTRGTYKCMRYADCTTVKDQDLILNRVKFAVSIQSFVPNLDGYTAEDGYGVIVDDIIGVHMDSDTGILKLSIKDLSNDPVFITMVTKIQIQVFLKKAGWNNPTLMVSPSEVVGLISN